MVTDLKTNEYREKVTESQLPVLIDFFATWCGPCNMLSPLVEKLSEEYAGKITVFRVNVDDEPELANQFGINAIPALELIKNGENISENIGYINYDQLTAFVGKAM